KRGPTGVIGTNKSDAADTVRSLLADCAPGQSPDGNGHAPPEPEYLAGVLSARGVLPVSYDDWLQVERAETDLATTLGRGARAKRPGREERAPPRRPPRGSPPRRTQPPARPADMPSPSILPGGPRACRPAGTPPSSESEVRMRK